MPNPARILISGYYGCGNLGDEAILAGMLNGFRQLCPTAQFTVLSGDPAETAARYQVEAIRRVSLKEIGRELQKAQLFVSGGGGLLQDVTSWRSPLYYLGLLWRAQRRGLRTAAVFQGIGPLRRKWLRRLAARIFCRLDFISVRDLGSLRLLVETGVPESAIHLGADAVWLLDPAPTTEEIPMPDPEETIGVFLRPLPGVAPAQSKALWEAIAKGLDEFLERHGGAAVFLPMQKPADISAAEEVIAWMKGKARLGEVETQLSPAALLSLTGKFRLVLGMRLHGLIFAANMGVPAAGIAYDPKVESFLSQAKLPLAFWTSHPDADSLLSALEEAQQRSEEIRVNLRLLKEHNRTLALQAIEMVLHFDRG